MLLFTLLRKLFQLWPLEGSSFKLAPESFQQSPPTFFEHFMVSSTTKESQAYLYFPALGLESTAPPKKPSWIEKQELGAHCSWGFTVRPTIWTNQHQCLLPYKTHWLETISITWEFVRKYKFLGATPDLQD